MRENGKILHRIILMTFIENPSAKTALDLIPKIELKTSTSSTRLNEKAVNTSSLSNEKSGPGAGDENADKFIRSKKFYRCH
jgi:hypothetical protein